MLTLTFTIVGVAGMLLLLFLGNHLLYHSNVSSRKFACTLAGLFAILLFTLTLISRHIDTGLVILAFILSGINFGVGYPFLYFIHHYYKSKKDR